MRRCIEVGAYVQGHGDLLPTGFVEGQALDPADGGARVAGEGRRVQGEVLREVEESHGARSLERSILPKDSADSRATRKQCHMRPDHSRLGQIGRHPAYRGGDMAYYRRPGWFDLKLQNPVIAALTRAGISVWGSRVLRVRGRTSGEWRTAPVNVLTFEGQRYIVAPRGQTQWVATYVWPEAVSSYRQKGEQFKASEIGEAERVPILRAYLKRWKFEVGRFFRGVSADSPELELRRIAPDHPVFRVEPAAPGQV